MYFWMASTICTYPNVSLRPEANVCLTCIRLPCCMETRTRGGAAAHPRTPTSSPTSLAHATETLAQVEGSVAKGFMRTVGIGVGGLLGLAASSNGALMNSPYYTTAIVMLLFAFFSLPAVVAEFRRASCRVGLCWRVALGRASGQRAQLAACRVPLRLLISAWISHGSRSLPMTPPYPLPPHTQRRRFTLCMIAYTIVGLVLCAYLGCCEAHSTWQSFAGKARHRNVQPLPRCALECVQCSLNIFSRATSMQRPCRQLAHLPLALLQAVPTALGALWATAFTALVLPNYASNDMLLTQADILRSSYGSLSGYGVAQRGIVWELEDAMEMRRRCAAQRVAAVAAADSAAASCAHASSQAGFPLPQPPNPPTPQPGGCRQYEEVMAAAQEGRAPDLSPLLANLQREAERIAGVGAKLRSSSVDRRLQPLAWLVLHTPPVVSLMQPRLKVLAGCAWASISTLAQVAWQPAHARPAGGAAQPAATSVIAGAYFKTMAADQGMTAVVRQMLQAQRELVEACAGACAGCRRSRCLPKASCPPLLPPAPPLYLTGPLITLSCSHNAFRHAPQPTSRHPVLPCADNLELGRLPAQVTALRERVAASLTAAIDARVACVAHFREQRPQLLAQLAGVPCQVTDLAFCGWMSSMISALDEVRASPVAWPLDGAARHKRRPTLLQSLIPPLACPLPAPLLPKRSCWCWQASWPPRLRRRGIGWGAGCAPGVQLGPRCDAECSAPSMAMPVVHWRPPLCGKEEVVHCQFFGCNNLDVVYYQHLHLVGWRPDFDS